MDSNPQLEMARRLVDETHVNVFLTGKAGTGKTTFLKDFIESTSKRTVVLAPTGIAAINAGGMTIHSFFQLGFSPFVPGMKVSRDEKKYNFSRDKLRLIKTLDLLVIDEISMVRADLLDAVDDTLRRLRDPLQPFGGVQLLLIGDLNQLPPVAVASEWDLLRHHYPTPYFFSSKALALTNYVTLELEKVYRQADKCFLSLLNRIRDNTADDAVLEALNKRYIPGFQPPAGTHYIRLTTHNQPARELNEMQLQRLGGPLSFYQADVEGDFPESSFPADRTLALKAGAQVMFVKNDPEHRFYNGMIGTVSDLSQEEVTVVTSDTGAVVKVTQMEWDNNRYELDPKTQQVTERPVGTFRQIPLRLAWAITIHKSQGLTFDHAVIDASRSFTHGQAYVALSRCRSLEGLVLDRPLTPQAIICDPEVAAFSSATSVMPDEDYIAAQKKAYAASLFTELFSLRTLKISFDSLRRYVDEYLSSLYPSVARQYADMKVRLDKTSAAADRFLQLYAHGMVEPSTDYEAQTASRRLADAVPFFSDFLQDLVALLHSTPTSIDNSHGRHLLNVQLPAIAILARLKLRLLSYSAKGDFSAETYLKIKMETTLQLEGRKSGSTSRKSCKGTAHADMPRAESVGLSTPVPKPAPEEIKDKVLFEAMRSWRNSRAIDDDVAPFQILSNAVMISICNALPRSGEELVALKGVGKRTLERYGDDILSIVASHAKN